MKRLTAILLLTLLNALAFGQIATDTVYRSDVKSVVLTTGGLELERPLLRMGPTNKTTERLLLRFDVLNAQSERFRYRIRHCDADWRPDDLMASDFISGMEDGAIEDFDFSFNTLQPYVSYHQYLPGSFSAFTASGNYLLEVYSEADPGSVILSRRFYVVEELTRIEMTVGKPTGAYGNVFNDQELTVGITPLQGSFLPATPQFYQVVAQQNRRIDNCRSLKFSGYSGGKMMYQWQRENTFAGGNCFRYFDLSDLNANLYHVQRVERWGGEIFVFLQPDEDRSRKAYTQVSALNGGMKINIRNRTNPLFEADYVWVNFSLPLPYPFMNGSVHIVGDLTDWSLGENSRMEWQPTYRAYTKRMLLKQGYYSYQLLFLPVGEHEANTATLEGDHYVTQNSYAVFVYLRQPGARYDRLVGFREMK